MARKSTASINVARMLFVLLCLMGGVAIVFNTHHGSQPLPMWMGVVGSLLLASFMIFVESLMKGFTLRGFSTATFGLLVGLFCAWLLSKVQLERLLVEILSLDESGSLSIELAVNTVLYASFGFFGVALALRTSQEDFAFVVPYVRFRRDGASGQPIVVDSEVLVDGRLPALLASGFLRGRVVIPLFSLEELQVMVNSPSSERSVAAQRALEQIEMLQAQDSLVEVTIHDATLTTQAENLDARLIETAQNLGARLLTIDSNVAKAARVRGASVLNIDELTEALKPSVVIGQRMNLALVRPGKDDHQAIGYLPDGMMIVVNDAVALIGTSQNVRVISLIQTTAGQMVFAELVTSEGEGGG